MWCDFRPDRPTLTEIRSLARHYAAWADTVLLGDHHEKVEMPNVLTAAITIEEGLAPWVTLSCRDRNRVALEGDLAALAELGVAGVHCVTGDARAAHVRPGSTPVFDLDSLRLTALARSFGLTVSVAESPTVEPVSQRSGRVVDKQRAGASWCIVNVGPDAGQLRSFIAQSRQLGANLRFAACVPVFTDATGADRLRHLPGVQLDAAAVAAVLSAADPVAAGVEHATARAESLLAVDGIDGINLSGPASTQSVHERADVMRFVAERLR